MSGVIQNTAEHSVLKGVVTSYFDDSLHSFVNACQLVKDEVYSMENSHLEITKRSCGESCGQEFRKDT